MVSKTAPARIESGRTHISRRTVARGVAWSAPIAAVAYAAPAFATSPEVITGGQCGVACEHPGTQNDKTYHFTFCFKATGAVDNNQVTLGLMDVGADSRQAYAGLNNTVISTPANATTCYFVDVPGFSESSSEAVVLHFTYAIGGVVFQGCASGQAAGSVCCTTGRSPLKDQPKDWPHAATGTGLGSCTPTCTPC